MRRRKRFLRGEVLKGDEKEAVVEGEREGEKEGGRDTMMVLVNGESMEEE